MKLLVTSALMIVSGYYGELFVSGDLTPRWICFSISMCFFMYIMGVLDALLHAAEHETDAAIKRKIKIAIVMTCVSWCTYPVVYTFPLLKLSGAWTVVGIQMGYSIADIISKCGVGILIYQITSARSQAGKQAQVAMPLDGTPAVGGTSMVGGTSVVGRIP